MFNKIKRINSQETDKVDSELNNARRECQEILNNINIVKGEHDKY
jgi:flagellar biosynthesis chaperone FliJ